MIVLTTERLLLRRLEPDDLDALFALYRDPEVRRYFPDGTRTLEQTKDELEWFLGGHPADTRLGLWATIERTSGRFLGRCGLLPWTIEGQAEIEVAYLIDPAFQRRGFGTEAARGIVRHAFGELRLPRLISLIAAENTASRRVAERIGMRLEKEIVDEFGPALVYALANPALAPPATSG